MKGNGGRSSVEANVFGVVVKICALLFVSRLVYGYGEIPPIIYARQDFNQENATWQSGLCNPIGVALDITSRMLSPGNSRVFLDRSISKQGASLRFAGYSRIGSIPFQVDSMATSFQPTPNYESRDFSISFWLYAEVDNKTNDYSGGILKAVRVNKAAGVDANEGTVAYKLNISISNECGNNVSAIERATDCLYFLFEIVNNNKTTILTRTPTGVFTTGEWMHAVFIYSSRGPSIWINGACRVSVEIKPGLIRIKGDPNAIISADYPWGAVTLYEGFTYYAFNEPQDSNPNVPSTLRNLNLDELRFYASPLTKDQIYFLYEEDLTTIRQPVNLRIISPIQNETIPVIYDTTFFALAQGNPVQSDWSLVKTSSPKCGDLNYTRDELNTTVTWNGAVGNYTFQVCSTTGYGTSTQFVSINITNKDPEVATNPANQVLNVGDQLVINDLLVLAFPEPEYRWQKGVLSTKQKRDEYELQYDMNGVGVDGEQNELFREVREVFSNVSNVDNTTEIIWSTTDQRGPTYNGGILQATDNLTYYRVYVNSTELPEGVYTTPIRVFLLPVPNDIYNSDNQNTGKIIGGVLGGVLGLCCCCVIIVLLVVLKLFHSGLLRRRRAAKKLLPPDYQNLTYSTYRDPLYNKKSIKADNKAFGRFESLLLRESNGKVTFPLATAIAESEELNQEAIKGLVWVFQYHGRGVELLKELIAREVSISDSEGTLFRANSPACQFYTLWVKTFGGEYVWNTLVVPVNDLNDNAIRRHEKASKHRSGGYRFKDSAALNSGFEEGESSTTTHDGRSVQLLTMESMEVDPTKLEQNIDPSDRTVNTLQLWLVAQKLFNSILKSHPLVPEPIRIILRFVNQSVLKKFDSEAAFRGMGAFMFLRYICPSLLAPHQWGLLDDVPHAIAQRQLILLGKVIQNLANGTLPGSKEEYMEKLNEFILGNREGLDRWYEKVVEGEGVAAEVRVEDGVKENAVRMAYGHVWENSKEVKGLLKGMGESGLWDEVEAVIGDIGDSSKWQKNTTQTTKK